MNTKICLALLLPALMMFTACQDLFQKHADEETLINTPVETFSLRDSEWHTGKIASSSEVDVYKFSVESSARYWIEWADSRSEAGLISELAIDVQYEDDPGIGIFFDETVERGRKRFWSYRNGFLLVSVKGKNAQASGDYRIRLHQTSSEELTAEGFLPAPKEVGATSSNTVVLTWTVPASQSHQVVYRVDSKDPSTVYYYASINNQSNDLSEREYTFVDYFTVQGRNYVYYIEGETHNEDFGYWNISSTLRTKPVQGRGADDHQSITGQSTVTLNKASGDLVFDPPLPVMTGHPIAAGEGLGDLELTVGESNWTFPLEEEELSSLNLYTLIEDDPDLISDMRNGTWKISYYPMYYYNIYLNATEEDPGLQFDYSTYNPNSSFQLYVYGDAASLQLDRYRAPAHVRTKVILSNEMEVFWDELPPDVAYEVWRADGTGSTSFSKIGTVTHANADHTVEDYEEEGDGIIVYSDTSVTGGQTYTYKIKSIYPGNNQSGFSEPVTIATPMGAPPAPTGVTVTVGPSPSTSLSISWTAVSGATGYYVWRASSESGEPSDGAYNKLTPAGITAASYMDTGLNQTSTYYYKIQAYTGTLDSGRSSAQSRKTGMLNSNTWYEDTVSTGTSVNKYAFSVSSGTIYTIQWNDSYDGTTQYAQYSGGADIQVGARYDTGEAVFAWEWVDSGYYSPYTFTATRTGNIIISVRSYVGSQSYTGKYGIQWRTGNY